MIRDASVDRYGMITFKKSVKLVEKSQCGITDILLCTFTTESCHYLNDILIFSDCHIV